MPSVNSILTMVKNLSLVGAGDSADDNRIMLYMNLVYSELYAETAESYPTLLLTSENVTITSGAGTISQAPQRVMRVKDNATNIILTPTSLLDLEDDYPALDGLGAPRFYYMTSETALATYPVNSTTVRVRYVARPATLTTASAESDIKIPPQFHDALVWGTLVYQAMDERDKVVGAELNTAQSKYEIALNRYRSWLAFSQTDTDQRTEAVLGG